MAPSRVDAEVLAGGGEARLVVEPDRRAARAARGGGGVHLPAAEHLLSLRAPFAEVLRGEAGDGVANRYSSASFFSWLKAFQPRPKKK